MAAIISQEKCPTCGSELHLGRRIVYKDGKKLKKAICQNYECPWSGHVEVEGEPWISISYTNEDCVSRAEDAASKFQWHQGLISLTPFGIKTFTFSLHDVRQVWINFEAASLNQALDLIYPIAKRSKDDWDWIPHRHQYIHNIRHRTEGTETNFFCTICNRNVGSDIPPTDGDILKTDERTGGKLFDHDITPPEQVNQVALAFSNLNQNLSNLNQNVSSIINQAAKAMTLETLQFARKWRHL